MKIEIKGVIVPNNYAEIYEWLGIENISPSKVNQALDEANGEDVEVEINSSGGYIFAGNEIYSALKNYKGNVSIRIIWAGSAASVIAMARHSIMEPTAMMMIHNVQGIGEGDYIDFAHESEVLKTASRALSVAYQLKTGKTEKEIMTLMDRETWFTAKEAHELGFVDEVADTPAMAAAYQLPVLSPAALEAAQASMKEYELAVARYKKLGGME